VRVLQGGGAVRMHRVKDFKPTAWPTPGRPNKRVYIQCGWVRFTATADEAIVFAEQLITAAQEARDDA